MDLDELIKHKEFVSVVSFEGYRMWNGQLQRNDNVTDVVPRLKAAGFNLYPMISSYADFADGS